MRLRFGRGAGLLGVLALAALVSAAVPSAAAEDEPPPDDKIRTLVILLDGFRWNFLKLLGEETSGFKEFIKNGASAEYVKSVFPSLSFPAWTTISTGVYPESHGILANFFYNRQRKSVFKLNDTMSTRQAFWWHATEPIWTTATRHKLRVATILWSRSDVPVYGIRPEAAQGYEYVEDGLAGLRDSLDRSVEYLEKGMDLVMAYSEHVDDIGHRYGPDSLEMKYTIGDVGKQLTLLFHQLEAKKLKDKVNVVLIGDHGMSTVDPGEPIRLRDHLDPEDVEQALGQGAFVSIYAKPGRVEYIYSRLEGVPGLSVWRRGEVPSDLHYNRNTALPDVIVSAKKGYLIRGLHSSNETTPRPHGIHGYQPDIEDMRTVFYAVGPDFARNVRTGPIELVDEYQVLCHLLRIPAQVNNGSWERVRELLVSNPRFPSWQELDQLSHLDDLGQLDHNVEDLIPNLIRSTPLPHAASGGELPPPPPPPANLSSGPVSLALSVVAGVIGWYIFLCIVTNSH